MVETHTGIFRRSRLHQIFIPLVGVMCLLWMIIRVIPKPSRAQYPCMKAAAPFAAGFLVYIAGLASAIFSLKKSAHYLRNSKYIVGGCLLVAGFAGSFLVLQAARDETYARTVAVDSIFIPIDGPNSPIGQGKGIFPGRVVWMWDSSATRWDGSSGHWWDDLNTSQVVVDSMLSRSLRGLTEQPSDAGAWDALFRNFNERHGRGSVGYQAGEKIAVKINLNQISDSYNPGNASFTSPHVVLGLLRQLVHQAGVQPGEITIYDLIRYVPDAIYSRCVAEFPGVHFMGWAAKNGREKYVRDTATTVHWSEALTLEIGGGQTTYLPKAVTQASYLINLASFKGHRYVGVSFCSKNHFGTISANDASGVPSQYTPHASGVHAYVAVHDIIYPDSPEWTFYGRAMGTYNALVDLMGHKDLGGKTLLFMIDALYGVQTEQDVVSLDSRWHSPPFNNDWTSSIFLSQDNVAIESVGIDFYRAEQIVNPLISTVYGSVDNYLHEAALASDPPSGAIYDPEGDGTRLASLGVHEHWNNSAEKRYTRNLGSGDGIELLSLHQPLTFVAAEDSRPAGFVLLQNYPNPFNPGTTIRFTVPARAEVELAVFDIAGRTVAKLVHKQFDPGTYTVPFNGKALSSGVYFCRMRSSGFVETRKLVLQK